MAKVKMPLPNRATKITLGSYNVEGSFPILGDGYVSMQDAINHGRACAEAMREACVQKVLVIARKEGDINGPFAFAADALRALEIEQ